MDVKGKADVMFFNKLDAITAVKKFNGLTLDGRPMQVALKDSTMSRRGDPSVASKALLFGSNMGGGRDQGYLERLWSPVYDIASSKNKSI